MQITRQADYAVRAVLYLAHQENAERAATSTIAKEQRIPPSFLAKIISQLSIAGLLHTSRGARGGVTLARKPCRAFLKLVGDEVTSLKLKLETNWRLLMSSPATAPKARFRRSGS